MWRCASDHCLVACMHAAVHGMLWLRRSNGAHATWYPLMAVKRSRQSHITRHIMHLSVTALMSEPCLMAAFFSSSLGLRAQTTAASIQIHQQKLGLGCLQMVFPVAGPVQASFVCVHLPGVCEVFMNPNWPDFISLLTF